MPRINLRKINQLIREAWAKGQVAALRGAGKSSCYAWSYQVAHDYFLDIRSEDVARIAQGRARLHWDAEKREIVVVSTPEVEVAQPMYRTIAVHEGVGHDQMFHVTGIRSIRAEEGTHLYIGNDVQEGRRYRITIEEEAPGEIS